MTRTRQQILDDIHSCNIIIDQREIFLFPKEDEEKNYELSLEFLKNIRLLEGINKNQIIIHYLSNGGDCEAILSIYDVIKTSKCFITILCHGTISSYGLIVIQASDLRISMPNCNFMFHEGYTGIHKELTNKQSHSWSLYEKNMDKIISDIFSNRCINSSYFKSKNMTKLAIKKFIKSQTDKYEDWFMTPEQAMYYGFIDDIIGGKKYKTIDNIKTI